MLVWVRESVTVKVTVFMPGAVYECVGFWTALVALSPKFHAHWLIVPEDPGTETSVKVTVSPTFGLEFDIVKSAVGATTFPAFTWRFVVLVFPLVSVTVKVTSF